eukprot:3487269-Alexandrium_andersonii.AAC.1
MPVRYDQARCCTELRKKAELRAALAKGFVPSGDFEIPKAAEVKAAGEGMAKQAAARSRYRETGVASSSDGSDM